MEKSKKGIRMYFVICILLFSYELIYPASRRCADDAEMLLPESGCDAYRNRALVKAHQPFRIGKGNLKYLLCRAIGGTCGLICNFYAVDHISISDASMLNKLSPFFAIICSFFVLKEVAGKLDWVTVIGSIRRNAACCEADDEHGDSAGSDRGTRRIWRRFCVYVCQKAWTTRRK